MSWVTILWAMVSAVSLTLAGIYLLVWWKQRSSWVYLLFSCSAVGAAAWAMGELGMMRAETPEQYGAVLRWAHIPVWVLVVSLVGFVRLHLKAGRMGLVWSICVLRTLALILNFVFTPNLNYREITGLKHLTWWGGETVAVAVGVVNPWTLIGQLSLVLLLVFCADAALTIWRRGERRRAAMMGGTMVFFIAVGTCQSILVFWGFLQAPFFVGFAFLGIVAAMAYELGYDVLRSSQLSVEVSENEKRMSLAVDAANFGMWLRDIDRNEIWASEKWRELFGFRPDDGLDLEKIVQRIHPDDRESVSQAWQNAITGLGRYEIEYRLSHPVSGVRWITSRGRVEFDRHGKPRLMRGASLDVTALKQAEQEAQLLQREIAHVGRVTMMGQLASSLAHEINQPLGAILRNAEAAELFLQHESPDLAEIHAILADIRADDQRASAVIERMRALLRRHELEKKPLEVAEYVGDVVMLLQADAAARKVSLGLELPNDLPQVLGDRVHLQQVLLNLIINGMDAINGRDSGVRNVTVSARHTGEFVEIAVSDSGTGITDDQLDLIFDPFFTTKPNGMGMGLAITRTIIEAHSGRIWAESKDGEGATFRFTLQTAAPTKKS